MSGLMPVLGLIPARGGSKGIRDKNLRPLAGRPLLAYTVDAAVASGVIDRLVLSTDSDDIAALGAALGVEVPFRRPAELATDEASMVSVIEHAVRTLEATGWRPGAIALLQPTTPLRRPEDIAAAVRLLDESGCDSVVSVQEVPHRYAPHYVMRVVDGRLVNFLAEGSRITRRQDVVPAYSRDGSVYVTRRDVLVEQHSIYGERCLPLLLEDAPSVNIDTLADWDEAERLIRQSGEMPLTSSATPG